MFRKPEAKEVESNHLMADTSEIRTELAKYLRSWRVARQAVAEARRLMRPVLVGHFVFTPVPQPADLPPA